MKQVIFQNKKRYSLSDLFGSYRKRSVRNYLRKANRDHLRLKRRQIVVFSFDHIALDIQLNGIYEKEDLTTLFEWLDPLRNIFRDSVAVDAGANIGNHSLFFSDFFKEVHSYEPNPRTFRVLSINAELVDNVSVNNFGLSDKRDILKLHVDPKNIGGASIGSDKSNNEDAGISIQVKKLDSCALPDLPISFIKIDVEGHELLMLRGAESTIRKHKPLIVFEQLAGEFDAGTSECIELLKRYGYRNFAYLDNRKKWIEFLPRIFRFVANEAVKLYGRAAKVVLTDSFEKRDYTFIVAIPDWCVKIDGIIASN